MNTGQMLLATGALVLLGTTVLTVNRTFGSHGQIIQQTEVGVYAVSLATSIIEEASGQNFDEATVDDAVTSTSTLTNPNSLGPESGESTNPASTTHFDDFDDYNGLVMGMTVAGVDSFTVRASVAYVDPTNPDGTTSSRTFDKRIDVSVVASSTSDTVKMSYVFSYFNFR